MRIHFSTGYALLAEPVEQICVEVERKGAAVLLFIPRVTPGRFVIPSLSQPRSAARTARNLLWNSHVTSKLAFYYSLAIMGRGGRPAEFRAH
jgi:hypothetical protein